MPYVLHDAPLRVGMTVFVSGDEAYHVVNSRRMRVGDRLALQDPSGGRFAAELIALGPGEATFAIQSPLAVPEPPRVRVTLLQAAVKDKAAEWIIQKSTEPGVAAIHFFPSRYGSVAPRDGEEAGALGRHRLGGLQAERPSVSPHPGQRTGSGQYSG
ncbi:MAG: RsmE family RNA methyltransferase [SAR324 cluster bacterium]|nr:RsmE family RNA methyltransferase [SAR324 cluster bacterium]